MKQCYKFCLLWVMALVLGLPVQAVTPGAPSDFTLVFDVATMSVNGSLKAPATGDYMSDYAPLETLTSMVVERSLNDDADFDFTQVAEFANPAPGETYSFNDPDVEAGVSYVYRAIAFVDDESSNEYGCMRYTFTGIIPDSPDNLSATTNKGNPPVTLTFTLPKVDDGDRPLTEPLTGVTIKRNENFGEMMTVAVITTLPADGLVTYVDNEVEAGHQYTYYVTAATQYGDSYPKTVQVKVGTDIPGPVTNLKAEAVGTDVVVTWDAPLAGAGGGYIDPAETVYSVRRIINGGENIELISGLKEPRFVDDRSELTQETVYTYRVTPSNAQGEGMYEQVRDVIAGPPSSLPYSEDFNGGVEWNKAPENNWESGSNKAWSNWVVSTNGYYGSNYESVAGANPAVYSDGYAWAQYTKYADDDVRDWYMTGRISLAGVDNPVMSVYVVQLPVETTSTLTVEVVDESGNSTPLEEIAIAGEEYGWVQHSYSLSRWAGADWIKLLFVSFTGENPAPVGFDLLNVSDKEGEKVTQFIVDGIRYYVKEEGGNEVSVVGYPGDDVDAVIPAMVTYKDVGYTVTEIGDQAFYGMPALASIKIPATVKRIGDQAFWGDLGLETVELSEGLVSIGEGAFIYCESMQDVELPATIESIGDLAFAYCKSLNHMVIPDKVTSLPKYIFNFCEGLTTVELPAATTSIGFQAFSGAVSLKNVVIPSGVTYIAAFAFEGTGISKITIPVGVTEIYNATFSGCASLSDVTFLSAEPPTVAENAFEGIAQPCIGHCPEGAEALYSATPGLEGITFEMPAGIELPEWREGESVRVYDLKGVQMDPASFHGPVIYVRRNGDKVVTGKVIL